MWQAIVICTDCDEESEVVVAELAELERDPCPCGYSRVVASVASFEPVYAEPAAVLELPRRRELPLAA